jgi:hypothetical protein
VARELTVHRTVAEVGVRLYTLTSVIDAVGAAVAVGAGVAVGEAVGAAVAVGEAVGAGVAVGMGVAVGLAVERRTCTATTARALTRSPLVWLFWPFWPFAVPWLEISCVPSVAAAGTKTWVVNWLFESARAVMPVGAPSQRSSTHDLASKLLPWTVNIVPGTASA